MSSPVRFKESMMGASQVVAFRDIKSSRVAWLWPDRIPLGKLTLLAGPPGLGKSLLTCEIAARVSNGERLPGASRALKGDTLLMSAEDDAHDTIKSRLIAANADLSRIFLRSVNAPVSMSLTNATPILRMLDELPEPRLLVIDPVSAYLGTADASSNSQVREAILTLSRYCAHKACALLFVTHLNKGGGKELVYRVMDSLAFVAAARSVLAVGVDPADAERRALVRVKSNLSRPPPSLAFGIEGVDVVNLGKHPHIRWEPTALEHDASDWVSGSGATTDEPAEMEWLTALLRAGEIRAADVRRAAIQAQLDWSAVRRAKFLLKIQAIRKGGVGAKGYWVWRLSAPTKGLRDAVPTP